MIGRYIEDINYLNSMICQSQPSEIEKLESLTVEGYYSTVNTWLRIIDEKNKAIEGATGQTSSKSGKRTSSTT
jgi:hypothetical protein